MYYDQLAYFLELLFMVIISVLIILLQDGA